MFSSVSPPITVTPTARQIIRRADSIWIGCGILFVILFFVAGSLAPESPLQTSSDQLFLDYYANNYDAHIFATSISVVSLLFFVGYISGLCLAFRRLIGSNALLPAVLYSMGLLATGLMMLAQACVSIEARIAHYKGSGALIRGHRRTWTCIGSSVFVSNGRVHAPDRRRYVSDPADRALAISMGRTAESEPVGHGRYI